MKITSTDIWNVVVPTIPGRASSECYTVHNDFAQLPKHIIRVNTDEGYYGLGESPRGTPLQVIENMAAKIEGLDPRDLALQYLPAMMGTLDRDSGVGPEDRWWERVPGGPRIPAYAVFEMALLDILGRYYDRPAHWFLGGAVRDRVAADYWIGLQTPDDARKSAYRAVEHGFKGMKMKHTANCPVLEVCEVIWDVAGHDFELTLDPNQRFWRYTEALDLARQLVRTGGKIATFEDPMPTWNLEAYRMFRKQAVVPVCLMLSDPNQIINAIKAEAVDHFNLGGTMVQFVKNAAIAHAAGIPCWHGSANDCGIQEFANLHAASAARNCVMGSDFVGSWTREDDLVIEGLQFKDGYVMVPDKPGLGCELDMDAIEKYRVK